MESGGSKSSKIAAVNFYTFSGDQGPAIGAGIVTAHP